MKIMDGYQTEKYVESLMSTEAANPPKMTGWICPVCGRGLSPFTSVCPCKGCWTDMRGVKKWTL